MVRYPSLTFCVTITAVLFLVVIVLAANGWDGAEITSNCYEDYLTQPDCFCERLHGGKPGDVWIAQPINTITNLYFVLVGFWIAYVADSQYQTKLLHIPNWMLGLPSPEEDDGGTIEPNSTDKQTLKPNNLMTESKIYATTLALSSCLLGVGSTMLHASFTNWGRQSDMFAMYLIATHMILYPLLRHKHITPDKAKLMYVLGNLGLGYWVTNVSTPLQARQLFTTLMVTSWGIEIWGVNDPKWLQANVKSRRIFFANLIMFVIAVIQWKASESGGPLCNPDSLWQGHSLWHFQSAVGIGGVFLYYLAEEQVLPTKVNLPSPIISSMNNKGGNAKSATAAEEQLLVSHGTNCSSDYSSNSSTTMEEEEDFDDT